MLFVRYVWKIFVHLKKECSMSAYLRLLLIKSNQRLTRNGVSCGVKGLFRLKAKFLTHVELYCHLDM